jgi:tRNA(Arg) A34 adenosine deaminase TadA
MYDERFMRRAIEISRRALTEPGTEPFGAVVVRDGTIFGEGLNHSTARWDPTSHGETEAIRDACRRVGSLDLTGADLYSSCEPCALCVAAMTIAGIRKLYYAASLVAARHTLAGAARPRRPAVDIELPRSECGKPAAARAMPSEQRLGEEAVGVLEAWAAARKV